MRPSRSGRARAVVMGLALLWLALGFANVARGLAHTGPRYRFWSFQHFCYSDIIAMHGDRYLGGGHPRPYLDDRIEYPVLLGIALWLPHWVPGGAAAHLLATYLFLALCLLAALLALERTPGASPAWLGATPALVLYAGLNWDLLPIALLAGAALLLARGRDSAAAATTGLGVSAKLFPGVLVLPAAGALWGGAAPGQRLRAVVRPALALLGVMALVNVPFLLRAPESWGWFFRFNAGRGAENSVWRALSVPKGPLLELLSTGPLLAASGFALWAAAATARRRGDAGRAVRLGAALALVVWISTNKVWSPQYALYGFLAGALVAAPGSLFAPLTLVSLVDYWSEFELRSRRWERSFLLYVDDPLTALRAVLWLVLAAWLARELWRAARRT